MLKFLKELLELNNLSALELYIASKNPQNAADIERYSREYHEKATRGYFSV